MSKNEKLQQQLDRLGRDVIRDTSIADEVMGRLGATEIKAVRSGNIWRIIMKTRITKYSIAAAVLLVAALIWFSTEESQNLYGMVEAQRQLYSAGTIHLKGTWYFPTPNVESNDPVPSAPLEYWLDRQNGRWRSVSHNVSESQNGPTIIDIYEDVCQGDDYVVSINHKKKSIRYAKISPYNRELRLEQNMLTFFYFQFGHPEFIDDYVMVGQEEIDGIRYNIWELVSDYGHGVTFRLRGWLSPQTGQFAKTKAWMRSKPDQWELRLEIDLMEENIQIPDEVFDIQTDGYTLTNTRETAPLSSVETSGAYGDSLALETQLAFALPDKCIVLCWRSQDDKSETSQDALFESLTFGGPLPKLPFEIDRLKPMDNDTQDNLRGVHLTHTFKEKKYYEWSLYVPTAPGTKFLMGLKTLYTDNVDYRKVRFSAHLYVRPVLTIDSSEMFERWIIGGMAELSDSGHAPEGITYESVMQLAQEIRLSLEN